MRFSNLKTLTALVMATAVTADPGGVRFARDLKSQNSAINMKNCYATAGFECVQEGCFAYGSSTSGILHAPNAQGHGAKAGARISATFIELIDDSWAEGCIPTFAECEPYWFDVVCDTGDNLYSSGCNYHDPAGTMEYSMNDDYTATIRCAHAHTFW